MAIKESHDGAVRRELLTKEKKFKVWEKCTTLKHNTVNFEER